MQPMLEEIIPQLHPPVPLERAFPGRRFDLAIIDPPWPYANWTQKKHGAAVAHYSTMALSEIQALPLPSVLAVDDGQNPRTDDAQTGSLCSSA